MTSTSHAVDLWLTMAVTQVGKWLMYDDIADAMKAAALKQALKYVGAQHGH